ncbi:hypothetical protein QYM36_012612 [Artemia franciscana]|uniref:PiggyBac transposable element-derived protein domain-containing protein n=1 Tax=Artemia franciscana TaxID=6661 RepID=A0AA88L075_ARTSF|nr:hypothetical protein QYM36_012612 [Artemia franciscana]
MFDKIKCILLFDDNEKAKKSEEQGTDKLYKFRPVLSHIRSKFLEVSPEEHHSFDEQMIPFKGRSNLRHYLPKKMTKRGKKVFTRTGVSVLVHDFEVYQGKGTLFEDDIEPHLGIGEFGYEKNKIISQKHPNCSEYLKISQEFLDDLSKWIRSTSRLLLSWEHVSWFSETVDSSRHGTCVGDIFDNIHLIGRVEPRCGIQKYF